jgi:hypothetical protein
MEVTELKIVVLMFFDQIFIQRQALDVEAKTTAFFSCATLAAEHFREYAAWLRLDKS